MITIRERLSEKAARNRIPIISAFELLPVCNLQCKMCYVRKSMSEVHRAGGLKDGKWWLNLAKEAAECGLLYPLLTGGEPFLHPDFFEILQGMNQMGLQVSINSNGTLINRETVMKLKKSPPIRINITLYGGSEKSYENLCGDGSAYHRVRQAVELLQEFEIPIKFNASITPDNVEDLEKIVSYAKERKVPLQMATYMFPPIRRDSTMVGKNARLNPKEAALARVKADYLQNDPEWFAAQAHRFQKFVPLEQLKFDPDSSEELSMRCRAGLCSYWIDWQGNMTNCGMFSSAAACLETQTFKQAWEELTSRTAQVRYQPVCAQCPNRSLCHPCVAMISNECGNLQGKPEYMCQMNQAMAQYYKEYVEKYYPNISAKEILSEKEETEGICEI